MVTTDLRYALRSISRQKTATALVLLMLSLGIAANVAVFSLVNGLFLRPFAFPEQDRLVFINETAPKWNLEIVGINYPDFHAWREGVKLFEGIALWDGQAFNLSTPTGAERIRGAVVTYDLAKVLGIRPILGRDFRPEEDKPKGPPVVLITEGVWRERFGGRPDVLGQTLQARRRLTHDRRRVAAARRTFRPTRRSGFRCRAIRTRQGRTIRTTASDA